MEYNFDVEADGKFRAYVCNKKVNWLDDTVSYVRYAVIY